MFLRRKSAFDLSIYAIPREILDLTKASPNLG